MTKKLPKHYCIALCCLLLAPLSLWAFKFSMPEDVAGEELTDVPMEEVDYGDSKNPLERNGEPIEKLPEATSLPDTELAGSEEALDTETEETGFIEFPLLEAESAAEVSAVLAEGEGRIVGQVFDKETGAPVRGVAIAVEGTELGTITDTD
jgi:hypothetical protein